MRGRQRRAAGDRAAGLVGPPRPPRAPVHRAEPPVAAPRAVAEVDEVAGADRRALRGRDLLAELDLPRAQPVAADVPVVGGDVDPAAEDSRRAGEVRAVAVVLVPQAPAGHRVAREQVGPEPLAVGRVDEHPIVDDRRRLEVAVARDALGPGDVERRPRPRPEVHAVAPEVVAEERPRALRSLRARLLRCRKIGLGRRQRLPPLGVGGAKGAVLVRDVEPCGREHSDGREGAADPDQPPAHGAKGYGARLTSS